MATRRFDVSYFVLKSSPQDCLQRLILDLSVRTARLTLDQEIERRDSAPHQGATEDVSRRLASA
jgi:hypothetical protein